MSDYKVLVNDDHRYAVNSTRNALTLNGAPLIADILQTGPEAFHMLRDGSSYRVEVVSRIPGEKTMTLKVNGNLYHVRISDSYDELLQKLGFEGPAAGRSAELKAPMPGMVLRVMVKEGDSIQKGDNLLVLEAMKMENIIKAQSEGKIKTIKVKAGDKVEKNELMIVFE